MKRKGDLDIITLAVGMVPIILFLMLASFFISERPVKANLAATLEDSQQEYQGEVQFAVLLRNGTLRRQIGKYYFLHSKDRKPDKRQKLKNSIQSTVTDYFNKQGIEFGFAVKDTDMKFGKQDLPYSMESYVESPSKDGVEVELKLEPY